MPKNSARATPWLQSIRGPSGSDADDLKGAATRRHFHESVEREWLRGLQSRDPISLLLVNVDRFSLYNGKRSAIPSCIQVISALSIG